MKIVCLVKQVPHPSAIEFDQETKSLRREGVPLVLNPFDRAAVVEAVRLRDEHGGEVVVMTMGPPQAEDALRETLALGADRCVHLSDRVFALADTIGTSRTLALALDREGADVVLCGRKTIDSETWQVPPETAAFLGVPHLTAVGELAVNGNRVRARRLADDGEATYELELPAVVSLHHPALDEPDAVLDAGDRIAVWTAADLVSDVRPNDKRFGQTGSPTRVLAVRDVTPDRAGQHAADVAEAVGAVRALLAERAPEPASWDKPDHIAEQPLTSYDSWTLVELSEGRPTRLSLELVGRSRQLAGKLGGRNVALVAGDELGAVEGELAAHGAEAVVAVEHTALARYEPEAWVGALRPILDEERPHVLLIPATSFGRDVGPRLAGELQLGMTGDCVGVDIAKAGRLLQQKPAYGGNIVSVIMGNTTPQLATVRARMYEPLERRDGAEAEVRRIAADSLPQPRVRLVEPPAAQGVGHRLDAADVVVCVGPTADAAAVADLVAGEGDYVVAGTHDVCAAGLLEPAREVGLYGRPVAPRLLVALGVRGDFADVTGWVKARVVVALGGTEAEMPADVVFEGSHDAIPALVEAARA